MKNHCKSFRQCDWGGVAFNVSIFCFLSMQGKQKQGKRTETFTKFCGVEQGTLLCTDVAARGLDIKNVDWIVQYDPPDDPKVRMIHFGFLDAF